MFDVKAVTDNCISWIQQFFRENGPDCNAVLGISGGKDSSVCAALCVRALGRERVIGVLMPNGIQPDIDMAELLLRHLGIRALVVNIQKPYDAVLSAIGESIPMEGMEKPSISRQAQINLAPRLRMSTVYAVSQCMNGRVVNTCNLSEDYVGYSTRYGDSAGDFSPLANLTVAEVREIGRYLGLPGALVDIAPADGLSGLTDEVNLGFTYAVLDRYIRTGVCEDEEIKARIDLKHRMNLFKLAMMPCFPYQPSEKRP